MKVARTVWAQGKGGDNFKPLPMGRIIVHCSISICSCVFYREYSFIDQSLEYRRNRYALYGNSIHGKDSVSCISIIRAEIKSLFAIQSVHPLKDNILFYFAQIIAFSYLTVQRLHQIEVVLIRSIKMIQRTKLGVMFFKVFSIESIACVS